MTGSTGARFVGVEVRNAMRAALAHITRRTPVFRGRRRVELMFERWCLDPSDTRSYLVTDSVNGRGRIEYNLRDGALHAYYDGGWEAEYVAMVRKLYCGGLFVDIGSCVGLYPISVADLVRAAGQRVISIEPVPANLIAQRRNFALSGIEDIIDIEPVAIGDCYGSIRLDGPEGVGNFCFSPAGRIEVPMVTLDSLLSGRGRVGFIKMDIEGFEPVALRGARDLISSHRPIVFAEFNRERMQMNGLGIEETWEFFAQLGYRAHALCQRALMPLEAPGSTENIFLLPQ